MIARANVREFVWRCMLAQWIRGMCWRMLRYADYVDGMSREERKAYRLINRQSLQYGATPIPLQEWATVCVRID